MNYKIKTEIDILTKQQYYILENAIKVEVNKILKEHKNLVSFVDEMGTSYFVNKNGEDVDLLSEYITKGYERIMKPTYKYFEELIDLYRIIADFCIDDIIYSDYYE